MVWIVDKRTLMQNEFLRSLFAYESMSRLVPGPGEGDQMSTNNQVMGRMAAQDANSILAQELAASSDEDKVAAFSRIIADLGAPITGAKFVYARILKQLQQADLTINFFAYKF